MNGTRAYPLWLRVWHWANAALFLTLLVTGLRMHYSAPAFPPIGFRVSHLVHNVAGILLTLFYLLYVVGNLFLGNGRYYRIVSGDISPGLMLQARYYINGIFLGRPHPFPHGPDRKFNPLQKLIYLAVLFLFFPASILTGWALFVPDKLPQGVLGMPTFAFWAIAHTYINFFFSLFMIVHVYLGTTGETLGELYRLMWFGDADGHGGEGGSKAEGTVQA